MKMEALIPVINLSAKDDFSSQVRAALESHGCFLLRGPESGAGSLVDNMFAHMKSLFDEPIDVKRRYICSRAYCSYRGHTPDAPITESFGLDNGHLVEKSEDFTNVIWPQGNPEFCKAMNGLSNKMLELNLAVIKAIFESYGAGDSYASFAENICGVFRLTKYNVPPSGAVVGLDPHTDKNALTLLCENTPGVEILSRDGTWTPVEIPHGCFLVVLGDLLKAWSNGRMHGVRHKVTIRGNEDRFSCGLFAVPNDGVVVEVPKELVDDENPLKYKPLTYDGFMSYFLNNISPDALEIYAGV